MDGWALGKRGEKEAKKKEKSRSFFRMDFEGQRLAEWLLARLLMFWGAIGFIAGYATSSFLLMLQINGIGLILTCIAVLPDWPIYRSHPLKWLPPLNPPVEKAK